MASWEVCIDSMGHSIRVAEGRGGGWLHGRYALTPWDTASELLKVEGEGGWLHGRYALTPWDTASELLTVPPPKQAVCPVFFHSSARCYVE